MSFYKYVLFLSVVLLSSCESDQNLSNPLTEKLIGYWVNPVSTDTLITYTKASFLINDEYGFQFVEDHYFMERRNAGWCGTPPVVYADFDGNWTIKDSIISVTLNHTEGLIYYEWQVISVDQNNLTLYKKSTVLM
jgi:hypothetical protein